MIDTLRYNITVKPKEGLPNRIDIPPSMKGDGESPIRITRAQGIPNCINVEFSVPRVLYGENGILIRSQEEIDKAIALVKEYLDLIGISYDWDSRYVTRIDLCNNFPREFPEVYKSYRYCKPAGIKYTNPLIKEGESITWGSKKSQMKLKFYDKGKQVNGSKSITPVTRVELTLRKKALNKPSYLGDGTNKLKDLSIERCLKVYREYLSKLMPQAYEDLSDRQMVLASYDRVCPTIGGKGLLEAYYKNSRNGANALRKLEVAQDRFKKVDLMLGWVEGEFPEGVDIRKNARRR